MNTYPSRPFTQVVVALEWTSFDLRPGSPSVGLLFAEDTMNEVRHRYKHIKALTPEDTVHIKRLSVQELQDVDTNQSTGKKNHILM